MTRNPLILAVAFAGLQTGAAQAQECPVEKITEGIIKNATEHGAVIKKKFDDEAHGMPYRRFYFEQASTGQAKIADLMKGPCGVMIVWDGPISEVPPSYLEPVGQPAPSKE